MSRKVFKILMVLMLTITYIGEAKTVYIVPGGAGTKDGLSWTNAADLNQGMNVIATSGDQIWVKQGTYTYSSGSVLSIKGSVYGGFAGNEIVLGDRSTDPSLTVIISALSASELSFFTREIDGLTFNKRADGESTLYSEGNTNIRNCIFDNVTLDLRERSGNKTSVYNSIFKNYNSSSSAVYIRPGAGGLFYDCELITVLALSPTI